MARGNRSLHRRPIPTAELLHALGPAFGLGLLLTPKAYWSRVREGRSPFAPTLYERRRTLPRVSLEGRVLSQEPYLRPTAYCDSHAPEVIVLTDELRHCFRGDWEYAQAVYDFVRNEIAFAFEPPPRRGVVGTLEAGCGICLDKLNLLVALARAGGIPARYCTVGNISLFEAGGVLPQAEVFSRFFEELGAKTDWRLKKISARLRQLVKRREKALFAGRSFDVRLHPFAELKVGGFWIPADPFLGDAEAAALSLPLPYLGYDPLILRGVTGSVISRSEEVPIGRSYWIVRRLLGLLTRGALDYVNHTLEKGRAHGRQILAEVGKAEYIRRMRRFYVPVPGAVKLGLSLLP